MEQTYGYIRVSSVDQNEIRQRIALEQQAIPPDRIFMDKMSGAETSASGLQEGSAPFAAPGGTSTENGVKLSLRLEVEAFAPNGVQQQTVRAVSENCRTLKIDNFGFEEGEV